MNASLNTSDRLHLGPLGHVPKHSGVNGDISMEHGDIKTQLDMLRDKILLLGGKTEDAVYRPAECRDTRFAAAGGTRSAACRVGR